jgi:hypothetical protein
LCSEEAEDVVEESDIVEGYWKLNVSGMSSTGKRVLATGSASVKNSLALEIE